MRLTSFDCAESARLLSTECNTFSLATLANNLHFDPPDCNNINKNNQLIQSFSQSVTLEWKIMVIMPLSSTFSMEDRAHCHQLSPANLINISL